MGLSFQNDPDALVVIDSSAVINIIASGVPAEILSAFAGRMHIAEAVLGELREGRERGWPHADGLEALCADGLIHVAALDEQGSQLFESLVIGRGRDTLDDGEAATMALALQRSATAIIDERKAIRVANNGFPSIRLGSSVDLFRHPSVTKALGHGRLVDAVFRALCDARMRVLPESLDWVIGLLGEERAIQCPSLPRSARSCTKRH